jgi:hypothetical protein
VIDGEHALGPQKSFNRIITWEQGDFELQPPDGQEFMVELDRSTEALLMDALRLLDEYKRIGRELPQLDAPLVVRQPLVARLRDLTPEQLDALQLVHNHGTLRAVLDHTEAEDVVMAEAVSI